MDDILTEKNLVSVIVPAYNCEKYISTCIKSLINQTYDKVEIIIVYDPSKDKTLEIIKRFKEKYPSKINLIIQNKKTSPAKARNVGLKIAKGEYICFCDADDYFEQNKIKLEVEWLKKYKKENVGLVYTDVIFVDQNDKILLYKKIPEWNFDKWIRKRQIIFSSILTYTNLIKKVGGFNEHLDAFDDFDLLLKLHNHTNFKRIPYMLTYYRIHPSNLSKKMVKNIKNLFKILLIHGFYKKAFLEATVYTYIWIKNSPLIRCIRKTGIAQVFKLQLMRYRHSRFV